MRGMGNAAGRLPSRRAEVIGYITEAVRYCAISGGRYEITEPAGPEDEQGTCTLPDGTTLDVWDYYQGRGRSDRIAGRLTHAVARFGTAGDRPMGLSGRQIAWWRAPSV
jgi:putative hemolysin